LANAELIERGKDVIGAVEYFGFVQNREKLDISMNFAEFEFELRNTK
jgi:hypothetical protein